MRSKLIDIAHILKEKVNVKKLIAVVLVLFVVYQCISAVVLTEIALSKTMLTNAGYSQKLLSAPLSEDKYIKWIEENGETGESYSSEYVPNVMLRNVESSNSYMIMIPPLMADYKDMSKLAYHFYEMGFHVVVLNFPCETSYGVIEQNAIMSMVNMFTDDNEDAKVYILGIGVGAAAALLYSAGDVPEQVKGVIADSAYSSVEQLFKDNAKNLFGLSSFPKTLFLSLYLKVFKGWSFGDGDICEAVKKVEVPVLYIHGTEDRIIPIGRSNELFENTKSDNTEHVRLVGVGHAVGSVEDGEKYFRETDEFIRNTID